MLPRGGSRVVTSSEIALRVFVRALPSCDTTGILHSVDQYLNIKLTDVQVVEKCRVTPHLNSLSAPFDSFTLLHEPPPEKVVDAERFPQLAAMKNCFVRGSVRFVS